MFPCSFDHPPAPEAFLQELREVGKSLIFPRSALEKGSLFLLVSSQPYVFETEHKFTKKLMLFP